MKKGKEEETEFVQALVTREMIGIRYIKSQNIYISNAQLRYGNIIFNINLLESVSICLL